MVLAQSFSDFGLTGLVDGVVTAVYRAVDDALGLDPLTYVALGGAGLLLWFVFSRR